MDGFSQSLMELMRQVVREENEKLFVRVQAELDRREQYGTARELLTDVAQQEDEIDAVAAARLLGLSSSNTLLSQLRRGDAGLAGCFLHGKGKARRFSRARILALKEQRRAG